jgi:hypothetical protein
MKNMNQDFKLMNQTETKVSKRIEKILKDKVTEHNSKNPKYKATYSMLKECFKRGVGAYNTNPSSVRPSVTSSDQWALARVNGLIYALKNGKFKRKPYDTDLLPSNHPLSSKKSLEGKDVGKVPTFIKNNAKRGLEELKNAGGGLTEKTKREARAMAQGNISENKVVRMNAWFLRHKSDLDSPRASEYLRGEGKITAGQVAWLLWGGDLGKNKMRAQQWAERQVKRLERENKFNSAKELLERRNILREAKWSVRLNRFRTKQASDEHYQQFDELLGNWDFVLAKTYYVLLRKQVSAINKVFAENSPSISGTETIANIQIDELTKSWLDDVADIYESMTVDFAYLQTGFLLPEEKVTDDNFVYTPSAQERITRNRRLRPRKEVIEDGFYPRRRAGVRLPIERQSFNRASKDFVEKRLNTLLPDMSNTMKKNLNTALRKATDEVAELGLTGARAERHIQKQISKTLGKKNLGRAMNIARTEGTAIANFGMAQSAGQTGLMLTKEWTTRRDGKVRDAHIYMDRIEVDKDATFNVQGYKMNYPADSSFGAPPRLVCNCRCTVIYHERRI